jgi:hypothetical protein
VGTSKQHSGLRDERQHENRKCPDTNEPAAGEQRDAAGLLGPICSQRPDQYSRAREHRKAIPTRLRREDVMHGRYRCQSNDEDCGRCSH